MVYSHEVQNMCCVAKGPNHGPAPIPEEGKWVQAKEIKDISGLTHGIGWVCSSAGRLQADAQREGRRYRRGSRRDHRLLRYDSLCCNG